MRMKIYIVKKELEWLKTMQNEGRTRTIEISNFRRFEDNKEIEVALLED